ncbi:MAG: NUDIX domain-containing protein [Sphingobacteriales bacterium]|uniref:NUDIX hydrolase n=1 Tax=Hydrotalea flava TaxID=714549 RepID=UPI0008324128|nr:NUDIX domain-containing protein [Hydrotalea flava]RTL56769.1 MAG: NUDIX domain-containing protein [Sphingobacteriales bacterium]
MKKKIIAGGGLITNEDDAVLMIYRSGKWDLPKGKKEENETIEACALREITEETGLQNLLIEAEITVTVHEYIDPFSREAIEKHTHWFKMQASKKEKLVPQSIEDIVEVKWIERNELNTYVKETYPTLIEVFQKAGYLN